MRVLQRHAIAFIGLLCFGSLSAAAVDLAALDKRIGNEPKYEGKPAYLLLALGPNAEHRVWLVLDGKRLYVDREGRGDIAKAGPPVEATGVYPTFRVGDVKVGDQVYRDLQVVLYPTKVFRRESEAISPSVKEFLAANPDGHLVTVAVDVPLAKPLPDLRGGEHSHLRHWASRWDSNGVLVFADKPEAASVIHFGGSWTVWPDADQRLTRGRAEDLTVRVGTPGHGPGTFAYIPYDFLISPAGKPHVTIEYPTADGQVRVAKQFLEDRC